MGAHCSKSNEHESRRGSGPSLRQYTAKKKRSDKSAEQDRQPDQDDDGAGVEASGEDDKRRRRRGKKRANKRAELGDGALADQHLQTAAETEQQGMFASSAPQPDHEATTIVVVGNQQPCHEQAAGATTTKMARETFTVPSTNNDDSTVSNPLAPPGEAKQAQAKRPLTMWTASSNVTASSAAGSPKKSKSDRQHFASFAESSDGFRYPSVSASQFTTADTDEADHHGASCFTVNSDALPPTYDRETYQLPDLTRDAFSRSSSVTSDATSLGAAMVGRPSPSHVTPATNQSCFGSLTSSVDANF